MFKNKLQSYVFSSLLCFFLLLMSCRYNSEGSHLPKDEFGSTVISINGVNISEKEYLLHLKTEIANTYNYFYLQFGAQPTESFWTEVYEGERPIDYIKKRTDDKLLRIKIIQELGAEMQVTPSFDYSDFLNHWQTENSERKAKKESGQVVYGPIEIEEDSYYNYLLSNLEIRLKEKLNEEVFTSSESNLKIHYELMKNDHFRYSPSISIEYLLLDESRLTKVEVDQMIEKTRSNIKNFESLKSYRKNNSEWAYGQMILLDSVPSYGEENPVAHLKEEALQLNPKELGIVRVDYQFYFIRLLSPNDTFFRAFETVKDEVLYDYNLTQYNDLVEQRMKDAMVEKNKNVYDEISFE